MHCAHLKLVTDHTFYMHDKIKKNKKLIQTSLTLTRAATSIKFRPIDTYMIIYSIIMTTPHTRKHTHAVRFSTNFHIGKKLY